MVESTMNETQSAVANGARRLFGGQSPVRLGSYAKRILAVLLVVIVTTIPFAAVDHVIWVKNNYERSDYNGSTLRAEREYFRSGIGRDLFGDSWGKDSWRAMTKALDVLKSPSDHDRLYEKLFFEEKVKYQYAPTSMVPLYVLDKLGLSDVPTLNSINIILYVLGVVAFAYMMVLMAGRAAPNQSSTSQWAIAGVSAAAAILFYPTFRALDIGQIQVWINSAFIFACLAWLCGMKRTAGALIAFAATIKPQLGVFLLWALLWREWHFLAGFLVTGLAIGFASLALFGLHNHIAYLDVLSYLSKHGEAFYPNNSVNGLLNRALGNGNNMIWDGASFAPYHPLVAAATLISSIGLLLIALWPGIRKGERKANVVDLALLGVCATLASPIAWEHHYGVALPAFGVALIMLAQDPLRRRALIWLTVAWALATNFLPNVNYLSDSVLNVLQSYLLFGGLILVALLVYVRNDPTPELATPAV